MVLISSKVNKQHANVAVVVAVVVVVTEGRAPLGSICLWSHIVWFKKINQNQSSR